jgi:hypothetical protein
MDQVIARLASLKGDMEYVKYPALLNFVCYDKHQLRMLTQVRNSVYEE